MRFLASLEMTFVFLELALKEPYMNNCGATLIFHHISI